MTICLINFPTKKLPVKVPSIVTTVSHSSLHWTLSLLSQCCDKVKFKHPHFVEKFGGAAELCCEVILIPRGAVGPPEKVQPVPSQGPDWRQYFDTLVTLLSLASLSSLLSMEISRNVGGTELHGVNQANHQPATPSPSFQGVTKFLGLEWSLFIQSH